MLSVLTCRLISSSNLLNIDFLKRTNETSDFLLVGDLNAGATSVGCTADSSSGNVLIDYFINSDSVMINESSYTYFRFKSNYEEKLDLLIGSSNISNKVF
jgi:hypothetical protein